MHTEDCGAVSVFITIYHQQWFQDMHEEHALQAFKKCDRDKDGFISTIEFYEIMRLLKSHLLTKFVEENLIAVSAVS